MKIVPATKEGIAEAALVLRGGGVVAYPTETVYGLGVDPFSISALKKLWMVKGRPENNPVLVIVYDKTELEKICVDISERAERCIERFWPGPLSLLLPRHPKLPEMLTAGMQKICVRCPSSDIARALCECFGGPITSTSANRSGEPPAVRLNQVSHLSVDLGVDAGQLPNSPPSTIFDPDTGQVIREGVIPKEDIFDCLGIG
ncbi:MAG TPA: L-threonylcarbamoyladenylate synthase [Candidatus Hydrogenedentes bacterium]|nr:L-threonylcarbamoyladenylate synthase [Candidatus Hydrogenedentota bacterium]HOL77560.1 L-threonylcarbamoyladenylate synthase [Candidatus Hydrogenedentota bacterium]HPO84865.1 L-threonylcarbamoyladenylate synthase [Candidatus Hydrogenedentota bacterium]